MNRISTFRTPTPKRPPKKGHTQGHAAIEEGPEAQGDTGKIEVCVIGEVSPESCRSANDNRRVNDIKAAKLGLPAASGLPSSHDKPTRSNIAEDAENSIASGYGPRGDAVPAGEKHSVTTTQVQEQVPERSVRSTDNGRSSSVAKTCSGGPTTPNSAPLGSDVKGSDERPVLKDKNPEDYEDEIFGDSNCC